MDAHHRGAAMNRPLKSPAALARAGLVDAATLPALEAVAARYAVSVTPDLADLIDGSDPHDPIARQFVPRAEELETHPDESTDPIGDAAHAPLPGLVHRYRDRVLLKPLHVCPVYCRFCFRREVVGPHVRPPYGLVKQGQPLVVKRVLP